MSDSLRLHGQSMAPLSMGILQARIVEWVAMPSSRGSSQPRNWTKVSCTAGRFFTIWAPGKPSSSNDLWGALKGPVVLLTSSGLTRSPWKHSVGSWGERASAGLGFCFYGIKGDNLGSPRVWWDCFLLVTVASLVAQLVKNLPAMWETWVQSLVTQCSWAPPVAQLVKNPPAMWETWVNSYAEFLW